MWWKKHRWKVLVPALVLLVLAVSFGWDGGEGQPAERDLPPVVQTPPPEETEAPERAEVSASPASPEQQEEPLETGDGTVSPAETPQEDVPRGQETVSASGEPRNEPVPAETPPPKPVDTGGEHTEGVCTLSISCAAVLDNMQLCLEEKRDLIPADGWILEPIEVSFEAGESVFQVFQRVCREKGIHMEFVNTPVYNSAYIEGVANLYEFDVGPGSGWMYAVNGWFPNYGCSRYALADGDEIRWVYTCNYGGDVGGESGTDG